MKGDQRGVTLIELLITMAIIFILASIAMPISKVTAKRAKELELRQDLRFLREAIDQFKKDWDRDGETLIGIYCQRNKLTCKEVSNANGYPKSLETLLEVELSGQVEVTKKRYLRRIPVDPMTHSLDWGRRCYADESDTDRWCGDDIFDVYTRSEEIALDGTRYRDW